MHLSISKSWVLKHNLKLVVFALERLIKNFNSGFEVAHGLDEKLIMYWSFEQATKCPLKKDFDPQVWKALSGLQISYKC